MSDPRFSGPEHPDRFNQNDPAAPPIGYDDRRRTSGNIFGWAATICALIIIMALVIAYNRNTGDTTALNPALNGPAATTGAAPRTTPPPNRITPPDTLTNTPVDPTAPGNPVPPGATPNPPENAR
jgi:hypothetical protein